MKPNAYWTKLLGDGRSVLRVPTQGDTAVLEALEEQYADDLDRVLSNYPQAKKGLPKTQRMDFVATCILINDRRDRREALHADGLTAHQENDILSPWQYHSRLTHELWFESLDFLSTRTAREQIKDVLQPGGWIHDRALRVASDSNPQLYDGVRRGRGDMVGVWWSPPFGTKKRRAREGQPSTQDG